MGVSIIQGTSSPRRIPPFTPRTSSGCGWMQKPTSRDPASEGSTSSSTSAGIFSSKITGKKHSIAFCLRPPSNIRPRGTGRRLTPPPSPRMNSLTAWGNSTTWILQLVRPVSLGSHRQRGSLGSLHRRGFPHHHHRHGSPISPTQGSLGSPTWSNHPITSPSSSFHHVHHH